MNIIWIFQKWEMADKCSCMKEFLQSSEENC